MVGTGKTIYKTVFVSCPGNATTAGPEAIHQLVADLIRLGQPAAVVYFPFEQAFVTVPAYRKYAAPIARYRDRAGDLIVFSEIVTTYALKVRHADAAIWWMSVNNFTCVRYGYSWRDKIRYFKYFLKGLRPRGGVAALRHLRHFAQSHYALDFLALHNVRAELLSDPIPVYTTQNYQDELARKLPQSVRENRILFNPHKGAKITARLRAAYPDWEFMPLVGYGREQLAEIFMGANLYIDFGHHPGKDRLPREAAIHGCCVISGRNGSAGNTFDLPIPESYKLDEKRAGFVDEFGSRVRKIFDDFNSCARDFEAYRQIISNEQHEFDRQIVAAFDLRQS